MGRERYLAGQIALERFNVDVLLLDDAFQHRQLGRNVDILTVPVIHPFGNPAKLLPAGTLREPPSALQRADIILLTHADTPEISVSAKETVKRFAPNALVLESIHQPIHLYSLIREDMRRTSGCRDAQRKTASCGLWHWESGRFCGDPHAMFASRVLNYWRFLTITSMWKADGQQIDAAFRAAKADLVVTTQKDAQKLISVMAAPANFR